MLFVSSRYSACYSIYKVVTWAENMKYAENMTFWLEIWDLVRG